MASEAVKVPHVFITYSHDDHDHRRRVLALSDRLRRSGVNAMIDQYEVAPQLGWPQWCEQQAKEADFVLLVCTEAYRRRFELDEKPGVGRSVIWEAQLIKNIIYGSGARTEKFLPVLLTGGSEVDIPIILRGGTFFWAESEDGFERLLRLVTNQPATPALPLGDIIELKPAPRDVVGPGIRGVEPSSDVSTAHMRMVGFETAPYRRFIGRQMDVASLSTSLQAKDGAPIITIKGMGGMGKTALAYEVAEACRKGQAFDTCIWISTQTERFVEEQRMQVGVSDFSFAQLLTRIAVGLGRNDIAQFDDVNAKTDAIRSVLYSHRMLVILDNLETVPDRDLLIEQLYRIIGSGKILVTCRYRIVHDQRSELELAGLLDADGVEFLRSQIKQRTIGEAIEPDQTELNSIVKETGGSPLTMSVIAGQLQYLPVHEIIANIRSVRVAEDKLYEEMYKYMFRASLSLLSEIGQDVLISLAHLVPMIGAEEIDIVALNHEIEPTAVRVGLKTLSNLSLVIAQRTRDRLRYALHPLTHNVLNTDLAYVTGE